MTHCWLFHDWGKWNPIIVNKTYVDYEFSNVKVNGQRRICNRCGKVKVREI